MPYPLGLGWRWLGGKAIRTVLEAVEYLFLLRELASFLFPRIGDWYVGDSVRSMPCHIEGKLRRRNL